LVSGRHGAPFLSESAKNKKKISYHTVTLSPKGVQTQIPRTPNSLSKSANNKKSEVESTTSLSLLTKLKPFQLKKVMLTIILLTNHIYLKLLIKIA
jgi:hypothetical protein